MILVQEILAPQETVNDGTIQITKLCFNNGDKVCIGDELLDLETTKSSLSIEAEFDGFIHYFCEEGDDVEVGSLLIHITESPNGKLEVPKKTSSKSSSEDDEAKINFSESALKLIELENISKDHFVDMLFVTKEDVKKILDKNGAESDVSWNVIENNIIEGIVPYLVFGGGGHTNNLIEIFVTNESGMPVGLINTDHPVGNVLFDLPIVSTSANNDVLKLIRDKFPNMAFVLGLGHINKKSQKIRKNLMMEFYNSQVYCPNIIHKNSVVEYSVTLGIGNQIFAQSVVSTNAIIGNFSIINTGAIISHDCVIKDNVHISPGAVLGADVTVGKDSIIGMNVTVYAGVTIPPGSIIMNGENILPKDFPS